MGKDKRKNEVRGTSPQLPQDVYDLIKHCVRHGISDEDIFLCHEEKLQGMSQDSLRKFCKEYQNEKNEDHVSYLECAASDNDNDIETTGVQSISKNKKLNKRKENTIRTKGGKFRYPKYPEEIDHLIKKCVYDGMRSRQILKKYGSKLHGTSVSKLDFWCRWYRKERDEVSSKRGKSPKLPQDVDDLIKHCVRHNINYQDIYTVHEDKLQGMSQKMLQKLCEEYKNKEIEKKQMGAHTSSHDAKEADNDATATISINKKLRTNKKKNEVRGTSPQLPQDVYDLIKHCVRHGISYDDIFLCHEEKL